MPRDLSAGRVNHDYDRASTTVMFGIAGDIPSDAVAVLNRQLNRAKQLSRHVSLSLAIGRLGSNNVA
jgi:hypothetical protein